MKQMIYLMLSIPVFVGTSCNTEVDLAGDYRITPVVYCLLDPTETRQVIRIQKTFLMQGDVNQAIPIKDSSTFKPNEIDVKVFAINSYGEVMDSLPFVLEQMTYGAGTFPSDAALFYTYNQPLTASYYRFELTVKKNGQKHTAETDIVKGMKWIKIGKGPLAGISAEIDFVDQEGVKMTWKQDTSARIYQPRLVFYWEEVNNQTYVRTLDSMIWSFQPLMPLMGDSFSMLIQPNSFFTQVANSVPDKKPGTRRVVKDVSFDIYGGTEDFSIYYFTNTSNLGVIQDKPKYTNISDGLGIFSSRNRASAKNLKLSPNTINELVSMGFSEF